MYLKKFKSNKLITIFVLTHYLMKLLDQYQNMLGTFLYVWLYGIVYHNMRVYRVYDLIFIVLDILNTHIGLLLHMHAVNARFK